MSKIKVLSQDVVNKIAAGEVVERPASVVKELLENSIDAGAISIKIEIEDGGAKKIAITDNGCGLLIDDLKMCILPHATSKLNSEEDLLNIKSYGFRGEALASIVAVSKTTITSRTKDQPLGHELKIEGGYMVSLSEMGCPVGTTVVVEDLFYNVPARREFIRGDSTEFKAIVDIVNDIAIAYPSTGINFNHNGKSVYNMPKNHQLEDRVKQIFGSDFSDKLIPVFYEHPHIEIYGFVTKPEVASSKKKEQLVFVNKRSIKDKGVAFAVKEAFGGLIPPGAYPGYILFIDVPHNIVDVNVHPRKEEVRFSNTQLIFTSIKQAVKKALELNTLTPGSNRNMGGALPGFGGMPMLQGMQGAIPVMPGMQNSQMPGMMTRPVMPYPQMPGFGVIQSQQSQPPIDANIEDVKDNSKKNDHKIGGSVSLIRDHNTNIQQAHQTADISQQVNQMPGQNIGIGQINHGTMPFGMPQMGYPFMRPVMPYPPMGLGGIPGAIPVMPGSMPGLMQNPLGQTQTMPFWNDPNNKDPKLQSQKHTNMLVAHKLYIIKESQDGLIIYDQHAVHERILYEKLVKEHENKKMTGDVQGLLAPVIVNLSVTEDTIIQEFMPEIEQIGFTIEEFGPYTYKITKVPNILVKSNLKELIHEFLEDLDHDQAIKSIDSKSDKVLTYLSCRSAYKAGDRITEQEANEMIAKLDAGQNTYTCPHGRPVKIELTLNELAKMFKRTGFD